MPPEFWNVYHYLCVQWYGHEFGRPRNRWHYYHPALQFLETLMNETEES